MRKPSNYYLRKFDRIMVWLLVVLFVIYVISGYGIVNPMLVGELTGGLFTRTLSMELHFTLDLPVLVLVLLHVLIQLKFALIRWKVKDGILLNSFIIILGIFAIALLLLMDTRIF
jgi:thiosulfate reductase cytochrome b subunit